MKLKLCTLAVASAFTLGGLTNVAHAQATSTQPAATQQTPAAKAQPAATRDPIDIRRWDMSTLRSGYSAERLLDTAVYGPNSRRLGEVENFLVNRDGQITGVIVESQGFLEIGDTHFFVPWKQVKLGPNLAWIQVPVAENSLPNFSLFNNDESIYRGPGMFRGTQLLNDWVRLRDGLTYGLVNDIVFNAAGQIQAVVVSPDPRYGYNYYGFPYATYDPRLGYYALPYARSEINALRPFDYNALGIASDYVTRPPGATAAVIK